MPTGLTEHLFFICCDPIFYPRISSNKELVLLVNISSVDNELDYDKTCLLNIGDHPFVTHQSYVYYRKADVFGADSVSRNVAEGNFRIHHPCSDFTFNRILKGFGESEEVRPKIKRFYEINCK